MLSYRLAVLILKFVITITALRYDPDQVEYNLNENKDAVRPVDYWGQWENHTYHPSPKNWRFPFVTQTIDRYVDGDPTNNDANGTVFEHSWTTNQFRFGGDAIYIAGSPFINMPWSGDGYGPLDFTLLDRHHGTIEDWRALTTEIHRRDMYVVMENTMATMGDLIAFEGFVNDSAPFSWDEYDYVWKSDRRYHDFHPGNERNASCEYPPIWNQDGYPIGEDVKEHMKGCRVSEFDTYGDIKGTGAYPSWQNQMSKFASVQDRLREWRPDILDKIKVMSCIQIAMLDIDGFRMDKALQTTIDAMTEFANYQRECARKLGKDNFLFVGEVVGDPNLAATYIGRGKQPDQTFAPTLPDAGNNCTQAVIAAQNRSESSFIRPKGSAALDGTSFNYDIYGAMTRFLGLDGPWGAHGVDWVDIWTQIVTHNDLANQNTGEFDPRHIFGMTDQDVFRWPALKDGLERQYLGFLITFLVLPGIPMTLWGEEQAFYILENLAEDYVFGRTPMASSRAWQLHGCYKLSEALYYQMPFDPARNGCYDDNVSLDHRDPSHPTRNVIKRMYELRQQFPALNDGFNLLTLSTRLRITHLPGSGGLPSPFGLWSVYRSRFEGLQDFTGIGQGNQGVWMVYSNENTTVDYKVDCQSTNSSNTLVSAFPAHTTVKNLFHPYDEYTLEASTFTYGLEGSTEFNGCLSELHMAPWEYKAFVPKDKWVGPRPTITRVIPGHDARLKSTVDYDQQESVTVEIRFSSEMSCDSVMNGMEIKSTTQDGRQAQLNRSSVWCRSSYADSPHYPGEIPTAWIFSAELENVSNGVHTYAINNATTTDGKLFTDAVDRFMFRIGQDDNPMVFPLTSNYTRNLLHKREHTNELYISPRAAGADKFRYSTNWGSSFSKWRTYTGENTTLEHQLWSGTSEQEWDGEHVILHFWSAMTGSSDHVQHADLGREHLPPRRWPHVFLQGSWNQYGYDGGMPNEMQLGSNGLWRFDLVAEWPTELIVNVWGMNPDGYPDKSAAYGDVDGDGVLDWVPPDSLARNVIRVPDEPSKGYLGYQVLVNDGNFGYLFVPIGSSANQAIIAVLLGLIPTVTAIVGVWVFMKSFYDVKFNRIGISEHNGIFGTLRTKFPDKETFRTALGVAFKKSKGTATDPGDQAAATPMPSNAPVGPLDVEIGSPNRRTVLIATMEYEIEDWEIKIKIGGLGVMSSLMGRNLGHQDLIWVVPCVGGIEYPTDVVAESMDVTILGVTYEIAVQYHTLKNITFVLLDAPVFRKKSKADPYPARMDDLDSAIYYSTWNQCIAEALRRFPVDLYHINDYHGAVAQLHLLPRVIPCCLSLHNAEFQGMWPLKTKEEMDEISQVYNLSQEVIKRYVQFGEVFNLLHAGASYLKLHQKGFGAVGVSKKYGVRSLMRYPIFWGLHKIGALPNPDPSDTGEWNKILPKEADIMINSESEAKRGDLRRQAQEWAGLTADPTAELFVFVGRWSQQKGVDLIADVFFSILEEYPKVQLVCVGPVIDLYGKFAALKLEKMMADYPGRVCSKPEFTQLPSCLFSGAEFALIPSRDEPFGLVAVEFGRKGALGVGSRVGGLGQMPGWWFTIESTSSKHLLQQFKSAIRNALASKQEVRAMMRARSLLQRFPVAQWIEDLEKLQSRSISLSHRHQDMTKTRSRFRLSSSMNTPSLSNTPAVSTPNTSAPGSRPESRDGSPAPENAARESDVPRSNHFGPSNSLLKPGLDSSSRVSSTISAPAANQSPKRFRPSLRLSSWRGSITSVHTTNSVLETADPDAGGNDGGRLEATVPPQAILSPPTTLPSPYSTLDTPTAEEGLLGPRIRRLSVSSIVGYSENGFKLQNVDPFFTDSTNEYYSSFNKKLNSVNAKTSERELCIEDYLAKSEKEWFGRFHRAKLGDSRTGTPSSSVFNLAFTRGAGDDEESNRDDASIRFPGTDEEFHLGDNYAAPTGLKKFLQKKIGDWQIYSFLLAFGQIVAANSYQITLLTGENGQSADKLYIIASIYLGGSLIWWMAFRKIQSVFVLSAPFLLYGLAFFILGMSPYANADNGGRAWVYNVATALYAFASSSGSLYFALNFGTEGGTPTRTWAFRACVIQGTQQIYIAALWYWGATLTRLSTNGVATMSLVTSTSTLTGITTPVAVFLWAVGAIVFFGLPDYYRQKPGHVPSFYSALTRRKIVLWFFVMVIIQNYWLSGPYGRNWRYLWSSQHAPAWSIALLMLFFFVGIWALTLYILARLSTSHSWIVPIFAIGLGAPRWAQILWGTSSIGLYVPWGGRVTGALLGRSLWLWLGVLDAVQGVGFGMILLQTLTRFHVAFTLVAAQVVGSMATIAARATAPDRVGPGDVFPDFSLGFGEGLVKFWFWVCLGFQMVIPLGFFMFFRKEQLFKP